MKDLLKALPFVGILLFSGCNTTLKDEILTSKDSSSILQKSLFSNEFVHSAILLDTDNNEAISFASNLQREGFNNNLDSICKVDLKFDSSYFIVARVDDVVQDYITAPKDMFVSYDAVTTILTKLFKVNLFLCNYVYE